MHTDELILVSVDDHVVEPPDMFKRQLPDKWKARAPRVVSKADGTDVWLFENEQIPNIGLNAVAGRPPEEYGIEPTSFSHLREGNYDIDARIQDMNANGLLSSLCFPSWPHFCGQAFLKIADKDLCLNVLRAYNDWHIDEWAGAHPGRMIPLGLVPMWNPAAMAEEVRRLAKRGVTAVSFSENPAKLGLPSLHSDHWKPFWAACEDEGMIICLHIGSGEGMVFTAMDAPVDVMITVSPINIVSCAADLLWSNILRTYPNLKFALSEGGIGWIPYFLERIDYVYEHHHAWTYQSFGKQRPSELFQERIVTCFIDDRYGVQNRHQVGLDTICWECDYPHSDTTWPRAPELFNEAMAGVPDDEVAKISHENALRHFRFDPFESRSKAQSTVGALRAEAEAAGVDLTPKSNLGGRPASTTGVAPVTVQQVMGQLMGSLQSPLPEEDRAEAAPAPPGE